KQRVLRIGAVAPDQFESRHVRIEQRVRTSLIPGTLFCCVRLRNVQQHATLLSVRQISADPIASCYPLSVSASSSEPRGAGGTPGGIGQFIVGLIMVAAGGYLILNQVQVTTSSWRFGQYGGFGLTLLPLL